MLASGIAPRIGQPTGFWLIEIASSTDSACTASDNPFGSCCTTAVRLARGNPKCWTSRNSAWAAAPVSGMRLSVSSVEKAGGLVNSQMATSAQTTMMGQRSR